MMYDHSPLGRGHDVVHAAGLVSVAVDAALHALRPRVPGRRVPLPAGYTLRYQVPIFREMKYFFKFILKYF